MKDCIFCLENARHSKEIIKETIWNYVCFDAYPASRGHVLIIPKQHYATWSETPTEVLQDACLLITEMQQYLFREFSPDGFNIGVNSGVAAGQTVNHMHIHIIPRYIGDHPNPRGGIRAVIPSRTTYPLCRERKGDSNPEF